MGVILDKKETWGERNIHWLAFTLVIIIFVIYFSILIYNIWPIELYTVAQSGVFGDSFGLLTSLFSGLAFAGLLITISYQRRDIGLTKIELYETREEIKKQHRENNVFQLLKILNDVISQLDVKHRKEKGGEITDISTGRDCFDRYHYKLKNRYDNEGKKHEDMHPIDKLKIVYISFWDDWRKDLGHYFRTLFNIFEYLDGAEFSSEDKKFYGNIVRAQMSDPELAVLFHNCLTSHGNAFIGLAEKFELFDNLPLEMIIEDVFLLNIPEKAFGANKLILEKIIELKA